MITIKFENKEHQRHCLYLYEIMGFKMVSEDKSEGFISERSFETEKDRKALEHLRELLRS